ncbi:hypothetical protein DNK49_14560 [Azoarcus communis]|uniref:AB hydrolase-1 domain-containing protein n=2 Tax=Parazoarcus communis TaxID=41977 RepID=A0A323USC8_9RHOO|nr:alpha/beta hydrolase [Parazoarcus communis]PZA15952.1 hypothetical protein DNK49_14560 [Azoarcus communis] [Parazoarcus communis SWub3 = DSM 12120]
MPQTPYALYLHGGPGMSSAIERAWFGEQLPVLWWDQPRIAADTPRAFSRTVDAAAGQLLRLRHELGHPPALITLSFGALIALELVRRHPADIGSLTILAPSAPMPHPQRSGLRMAEYLLDQGHGDASLREAVTALRKEKSHATILALFSALLAIPDVLNHYFAAASVSPRERFFAEATKVLLLDMDCFAAVTRELVDYPPPSVTTGFSGPVRILFGRHDPLHDPVADPQEWRALFPAACLETVDTGHMIVFELPEDEWIPSPPQALAP